MVNVVVILYMSYCNEAFMYVIMNCAYTDIGRCFIYFMLTCVSECIRKKKRFVMEMDLVLYAPVYEAVRKHLLRMDYFRINSLYHVIFLFIIGVIVGQGQCVFKSKNFGLIVFMSTEVHEVFCCK